ncbi:putative toxin-antitoxin system toxin component, PIN family [Candidatus Microgenomates bacterium]|nr:putative toxin-antitoxin system toxin component, PIN family [Candidatus Microgenomates bacterium]
MTSNLSKPKVVIDTNVWISAIFWGKKPRKIIEAWVNNRFYLIASPDLLSELYKTIEKKAKILKPAPNFALEWLKLIDQKSILVYPKKKVKICRDLKDNTLLEACSKSEADYLITGDKDLLVLKTFKKTKIFTPQKFLTKLS